MKKLVILSVLLGLLAACSSNQSPSENSTTKTTNNSSVAQSTNTKQESNKQSNSKESQTKVSEENTPDGAFQELTKTYPDVKMPRKLPRDESLFLNIAAVGNQDHVRYGGEG